MEGEDGMFRFYRAIFISLIGLSPLFSAEIVNYADAVNKAGKQRMFTQRMLKDYAMIGMGNDFGNPQDDMKTVLQTFEEHLDALEKFAKTQKSKKAIEEVRKIWKTIKLKCSAKPKLQAALALQKECNQLLKASDTVVKALVKESGLKKSEIVDLSGRQRMLSQRMASLYMLKVWGVQDPKFEQTLQQAISEFKNAHEILKTSQLNDDEINAKLKKVERSLMFFEVMSHSNSKFIPSLIFKKSNEILKEMNDITGLYEKKLHQD
jgi:hypothetical protein